MRKILFIGGFLGIHHSRIELSTLISIKPVLESLKEFSLAVETTDVELVTEKKLKLIHIGFDPSNVHIPVDSVIFEWDSLSDSNKEWLLSYLGDSSRLKILQNSKQEYKVLRNYGIRIGNVWDISVAEKIILSGDDKYTTQGCNNYSLDSILKARLNVDITNSIYPGLEPAQILHSSSLFLIHDSIKYSYMHIVKKLQTEDLNKLYKVPENPTHLNYLPSLEMESILAVADMEYQGFCFDREAWFELMRKTEPIIQDSLNNLNSIVLQNIDIKSYLIKKGLYIVEDTLVFKENSPAQKLKAFSLLFPDIKGASQVIISTYLKRIDIDKDKRYILESYLEGNTAPLKNALLKDFRQELLDSDMLIPKGTVNINWKSVPQTLSILQRVIPNIKSTSEQSLEDSNHPIAYAVLEHRKNEKLNSAFGERFFQYVTSEDKIHCNLNPIVSTGRMSCSNPNLQNIPANDRVGNSYRNCFIPSTGMKIVSADFCSCELVIIAELSREKAWIEALEKGWDLHSYTAELVFKDKWWLEQESDCEYYRVKNKCSCKGHKKLRNRIKTVNFGLCYGMSEVQLSVIEKCSITEAKEIIQEYFKTFPAIEQMLNINGKTTVRTGTSCTMMPYGRKRIFHNWVYDENKINAHLSEIQKDKGLSSIERAGKNAVIQGKHN